MGVDVGYAGVDNAFMPKERGPVLQRSIRLPTEIWDRVRTHAEALSEQLGGTIEISDTDAIKDILSRYLPPAKPSTKATAKTSKRST